MRLAPADVGGGGLRRNLNELGRLQTHLEAKRAVKDTIL